MKIRIFALSFLLFLGLLHSSELHAQRGKKQEYTSKSKKAIKAFERAITFFEVKNYEEAIIDLKTALKHDSNFVEAYLLAGQMFEEQRRVSTSIYYYKKASQVNPDFYPKVFFILASQELSTGRYHDALTDFTTYLEHPKMDTRLTESAKRGIDYASFGAFQVEHPVDFNPQNLGTSINTSDEEYINTVSTDESTLIFTRKFPKKNQSSYQRQRHEEDFYKSNKSVSDEWQLACRMSSLFNTHGNEGAMHVSPDNSLMVFTACYREDGFGSCDLYFSERRGRTWSQPINMGANINTATWDSQASLSSDGKTMYFVSKRKGGLGGSDIYTAERLSNGLWGNVKNMGDVVNSKGSEMTPYIHPDGKTLYFSSDGHIGMGGADLFVSRKNDKGQWSEPENLGYPINDHKNQMGILINAKGNLAYISSDMKGGEGGFDIYSFEIHKEARPGSVSYMKGVVSSAKTKRPLAAKFELYDLNTNTLLVESESDAVNGSFLVVIPTGSLLGLNVSREGYLFHSEQFEVEGDFTSLEPFLKNVQLNPIQINQKIVLQNVFFASKSYELQNQSFVELGKVKELIGLNPSVRIEISGHTDNVGNDKANMELSEKRAKAVYDYLLSLGVLAKNISYKGYGETMPVADNKSEEGRSKNRRTELKVVGI